MERLVNKLKPKGIPLYFNEEAHRYTDITGKVYTSMTTCIGKYTDDFKTEQIAEACERIGRNPRHEKYPLYKGKSKKQLINEWKIESDRANKHGNEKHKFLEDNINNYNGFMNNSRPKREHERLYTVDDIIANHNFGKLNINKLGDSPLADKYPMILDLLRSIDKDGFHIYTELGVYDPYWGISGLSDLPCVHHKHREVLIGDWKTNKAPMRFDSGYYAKFPDGRLNLDKWIPKSDYFAPPLHNIPDSTGNHYTVQLSGYGLLFETFGYKHIGNVLCHIRSVENQFLPREQWEEEVTIMELDILHNECRAMFEDHRKKALYKEQLFD